MPWTPNVKSFVTDEINIVATVDFVKSETGETITKIIPASDMTPVTLAWTCQRIVELLEARDAKIAALKTGPLTLPRDATAGTPLATDVAARAAADDFFAKLNTLNLLRIQVDKGLLQATDQSVTDARAAVRTAYKPEYQLDPRFR